MLPVRPQELLEVFNADDAAIHRAGFADTDVANPEAWAKITGTYATGTYTTDRDRYELIIRSVRPGSRTLETGSGLSTLIFATAGCEHTTLFLDPDEEIRLRAWADHHGIDLAGVTFIAGPSDESLRNLEPTPLDVFLIDGGHGYPLPILDWFYGASRLGVGGVLVIDDLQIWAPRQLDEFLTLDPRWEQLQHTQKWSAYRRLVDGPIAEDSPSQQFLPRTKLSPTRHMNWKGRLVHAPPLKLRESTRRKSNQRRRRRT